MSNNNNTSKWNEWTTDDNRLMLEDTNKIMQRVPIKNATKQGYLFAEKGDGIDIGGRMKYHRGTVQKCMAQTIKTQNDIGVIDGKRIRKLTPKETTMLMGFSGKDYEAMKKVNSDNEIYKQCGNSIVVNVLMAIFGEML